METVEQIAMRKIKEDTPELFQSITETDSTSDSIAWEAILSDLDKL
jgi:hypothetical protein